MVPGVESKVADGLLDGLFSARQVLQPLLVAPEHVVDRHVHSLPLQVYAGQALQVFEADQPLHRPPDVFVHRRRLRRQQHEEQICAAGRPG
jgi:hypothetical protein